MCIVVNSPPGPRHNKHSFQVSSGTADSSKYGGSMFNDWRQRRSFPPFDGAGKTLLQLLSADRHLPFAINRGADFIHRWSNIYYTRINGNQESPSTTGASTNNKIFTIRSAAVTRWMNSTEKGVAQPKDNNKRGRMSDKGSWWMNISNRRRRRCRLSRDNLLRRKYHSMYRERCGGGGCCSIANPSKIGYIFRHWRLLRIHRMLCIFFNAVRWTTQI